MDFRILFFFSTMRRDPWHSITFHARSGNKTIKRFMRPAGQQWLLKLFFSPHFHGPEAAGSWAHQPK
jgi:hypothetical protein